MTNPTEKTILQMAIEAFGSEFAKDWLDRPSRIFDGMTPQQMANREDGAQVVMDFIRALMDGTQTDGTLATAS